MGRPQRRRITLARAWPTFALLVVLAACSGASLQTKDLLLEPGDFPGLAVAATNVQASETAQGQPAGQVELSGPGFVLNQSLVLFETQEEARSILAGIKDDQQAQGIAPADPGKFQDASGILNEVRGGQERATLFFVEGRALVRITISGPNRLTLLPVYAEKARAKASRR